MKYEKVSHFKRLEIFDLQETDRILYINDMLHLIKEIKNPNGESNYHYVKKIFPADERNRNVFRTYFGIKNQTKSN